METKRKGNIQECHPHTTQTTIKRIEIIQMILRYEESRQRKRKEKHQSQEKD